MYPISNRYKPKEILLPEEEDVQAALHEYDDDPERATWRHFTPASILYDTYLAYASKFDWCRCDPEILNQSKFGIALRRVYPRIERGQRTVEGKRPRGYFGLFGPGTILAPLGPGNPRLIRSREPTAYSL